MATVATVAQVVEPGRVAAGRAAAAGAAVARGVAGEVAT